MTCILKGGPDRRITVAGREYLFEMHPVCGPVVLNKNGSENAQQPGERHPFWRAIHLWLRQGRRVEGDRCLWTEPAPPVIEHIGGGHYRLVSGELE